MHPAGTGQTEATKGTLGSKRELILHLHKKLHSGSKASEKVKFDYEETTATPTSPPLKRSDVRRLLGDPLPLPYLIEDRKVNKHLRHQAGIKDAFHWPQAQKEVKPIAPVRYEPPKLNNDAQQRLRASVQNMLRPSSWTPEVELEKPAVQVRTPEDTTNRFNESSWLTSAQDDGRNISSSDPKEPGSSGRRIRGLKEKDDLIREFRESTSGKLSDRSGPRAGSGSQIPMRTYVFVILVLLVTVLARSKL